MNGIAQARARMNESPSRVEPTRAGARDRKTRVYIHASSVLLQERLVHALGSEKNWDVVTQYSASESERKKSEQTWLRAEILAIFSSGMVMEDLHRIHGWKTELRELRVLLLGASSNEGDFLRYVRSGVHGFLPAEAGTKEIVAAVRGLIKGETVCGGAQCATLFRYLEKEAETFPSAALHRDLGLTRREQQLIPLLTRGLTNKEIANHFSLSEQTVKNHLYRMKRKIGAHGRLEIVDVCRRHGFLA